MSDKQSSNYKYRQGVGAIVINSEGKILICQRRDEQNHWQFPQGGIDEGEQPIQTLMRELTEEIGTDKILPLLSLPYKTRYIWNQKERENRKYDGQEHTWYLVKFLGDDTDLKSTKEFTDFRWINFDKILNETDEIRHQTYKKLIDMLSKIKDNLNF